MTGTDETYPRSQDSPGALSQAQQDRIRYFWWHVFAAAMSVFIAAFPHFQGAGSWGKSLTYRGFYFAACLVGFVGNVWRAVQGWQLRSAPRRNPNLQNESS